MKIKKIIGLWYCASHFLFRPLRNTTMNNMVAGAPKSVEGDKTFLPMVPHALEMLDRSKNTEISATGKGIPTRHMSTRVAIGLVMIPAEATAAIISIAV